MGEMASYYAEQELLFGETEDQLHVWYTADGRAVFVHDLEDGHLLNIVRCLRGRSPEGTRIFSDRPTLRRRWVNRLANEAYRRGLTLEPLTGEELVHE